MDTPILRFSCAPDYSWKDKVIKPHIKWVNVIDDWCGNSLKVLNYCAQDRLK